MVIHQVSLVELHFVETEELEQILRVVTAMVDPLTTKDLPSVEVKPVMRGEPWLSGIEQLDELVLQLGRQPLIGTQPEAPLDVWTKLFQCPPPLSSVVRELMDEYPRFKIRGDCECPVGAAGVDDHQSRIQPLDA